MTASLSRFFSLRPLLRRHFERRQFLLRQSVLQQSVLQLFILRQSVLRLFVLTIFLAVPPHTDVSAQTASCTPAFVASAYDSSAIALRNAFFGGYRYTINGVETKAGGTMNHLADEFRDYPEIHHLALGGVSRIKKGRFVSFLGFLGALSNIFIDDTTGQIVANTGAFILTSIGTAIQIKGRNNLRESVRLYNRQLLNCE